jgi:hypothetical protein
LRFSALLSLTTDIAKIESFMTTLGSQRCTCYDAAGAATACPVK